jgi:hypothetical protein
MEEIGFVLLAMDTYFIQSLLAFVAKLKQTQKPIKKINTAGELATNVAQIASHGILRKTQIALGA